MKYKINEELFTELLKEFTEFESSASFKESMPLNSQFVWVPIVMGLLRRIEALEKKND